MSSFRPLTMFTAVLLATAMAGGSSLAEAAPVGIPVTFADLDLATSAGVDRLHRRVRFAAQRLCGEADNRPLDRMMAQRRCVAAALVETRPQVDAAIADRGATAFASRKTGEAVR